MITKRRESVEVIRSLRTVKADMKQQEEIFENMISDFRAMMTPVQSGQIIVFGEKNKLRREFALGETF
jgi:hypothetical protein